MLQSFKISLSGAGVMSKMNLCNYIQNIIKIFLSPTTYLYVPGFFPIFQVQQTDYRRQIDIIAIINSEVRILDMSTCVFPPHFSVWGEERGHVLQRSENCCSDDSRDFQNAISTPLTGDNPFHEDSMQLYCSLILYWNPFENQSSSYGRSIQYGTEGSLLWWLLSPRVSPFLSSFCWSHMKLSRVLVFLPILFKPTDAHCINTSTHMWGKRKG